MCVYVSVCMGMGVCKGICTFLALCIIWDHLDESLLLVAYKTLLELGWHVMQLQEVCALGLICQGFWNHGQITIFDTFLLPFPTQGLLHIAHNFQ